MTGDPILIVDDNPANLKVARVTLQAEGYEVRVATDGIEALAILKEFHPRVILMDIQLPGIDGLELTRQLKANAETRDIRIIAVTAYAMKGDEARALAAGCDGYLSKPLDPIRLPAVVAEHVQFHLGAHAAPTQPPRAVGVSNPPPNAANVAAAPPIILVIEDNPTTRKMIRVALQSHGYAVDEAGDGATALALITQRVPALVLQDLALPDIDGLDLVVRIRDRIGLAIPILCLTGFLSRFNEIQAVKGGFSAVLLKPVDPIQLLESVANHLERVSAGAPPRALAEGHRILVVDDDPLNSKLTEFYLTNAGFQVTLATDGADGLRRAQSEPPSAILSDILMPGMDGFQFCLLARRSPTLAQVPVVLVSSHYIEPADQRLSREVGASALVPRTPELDGVVDALRNALGVGAIPVAADPASVATTAGQHAQRVLWQLERQAAQNVGLARRCTVQAAQLAVLAGTAEALTQSRPLNGVLTDVLEACLDMAGISKGVLYLVDPSGRLVLGDRVGFSASEHARLEQCFGQEALVVRNVAEGKVAAVPSPSLPRDAADRLLIEMGVTSALIVPVASGREVRGALLLGGRTADVASEESMAFARVLGLQMAQAIGLAQTFNRLTMAEHRYRTLMENAHDAVSVLSPQGVVLEVNQRWEQLLGIPRDQIVGHPLREFAVPEERPEGEDGVQSKGPIESTARAGTWTQSARVRTAGGTVALLEISNVSLEIAGERVVFAIGRDVTMTTQVQAQLMVSDRLASVGTLAAGVAHEINNPLAAVMVNLDLASIEVNQALKATGKDREESMLRLRDELDDAIEAADQVRDIARDMKTFSRAQDDQMGPVDLSRVLESSLRMARSEIRNRARLVKTFEDVPPMKGNESRMGQVFLNLIVNAAQAIPDGHADTNEIRVNLARDGANHVRVDISDTGSGIPPDVLKRLFTPFFTTKPTGVGTGLGLSICQRLVTAVGGEITVESQVGVGTTFHVRLPVAKGEPSQAVVPAVVEKAPTRRGQILVVDDEPMILRAIERILGADHQVVGVTTAQAGLDRIMAGERFDVILCDLMMPRMSGFDLHAALLAAVPEQAKRMIFVTGGGFTARGRAFLDEVPNLRVEKPFDATNLRSLIASQLGS